MGDNEPHTNGVNGGGDSDDEVGDNLIDHGKEKDHEENGSVEDCAFDSDDEGGYNQNEENGYVEN